MGTRRKAVIGALVLFGITATAFHIFFRANTILYVSPTGDDGNPGTKQLPLQHITTAYGRIGLGGTVYVLPGLYRETVTLFHPGITRFGVNIIGVEEKGQRPVITGSQPASEAQWSLCTTARCPGLPSVTQGHAYVALWKRRPIPTVVTESLSDGSMRTLIIARSPNESFASSDKRHELWWTADNTNASPVSLTDTLDDEGLEKGNLKTIPDVTGGRAHLIDGADRCGAFQYERTIDLHDRKRGRIGFGSAVGSVTYGTQENGIGPNVKYYVENAVGVLDTPGEWYYDPGTSKIYVWPLSQGASVMDRVEIGVRDAGIRIEASRIRIEGLTVRSVNDHLNDGTFASGGIVIGTEENRDLSGITLSKLDVRFAGTGIAVRPPDSTQVRSVTVMDSVVSDMSKSGIVFDGKARTPGNVDDVRIIDTDIRETGRRYHEPAINLIRLQRVSVKRNHIRDNAYYGVLVTGYQKDPSVMHGLRIADNVMEHNCQNASACAAIKVFGGLFADAFVERNTLNDTLGWSYCYGRTNHEEGMGVGMFVSNASGIVVSGNEISGNSYAGILAYARQIATTDNVFIGNTIGNTQNGIILNSGVGEFDNDPKVYATRHARSVIRGNALRDNTTGVLLDIAGPGAVTLRGNTYAGIPIPIVYAGIGAERRFDSLDAARKVFPMWEPVAR